MKTNSRTLYAGVTATTLTICAAGCGGGSSDGSSPLFVAGNWTGTITKVSDTCSGATASQNISHEVSQNEGAVVVTDGNNISYIGNVVGEDGFSADGSLGSASNCTD